MPVVPAFKTRSDSLLPDRAPKIRMTIGAGTANHTTRSFRKPIILLGSGKRCDVVLANRAVQKAHCAIINTGSLVMLRSLCSNNSTLLGVQPVRQAILEDGSQIQLGAASVQMAIQTFDNTENEVTGVFSCDDNPFAIHPTLTIRRMDNSEIFKISEGAFLIGRQSEADLLLSDNDISLSHALIFSLNGKPVIADLGSRNGFRVNGKPTGISPLEPGDRLEIGAYAFQVIAPYESVSHNATERLDSHPADHLVKFEQMLEDREREIEHREEMLIQREKSVADREKKMEQQLAAIQLKQRDMGNPGSGPAVRRENNNESSLRRAESFLKTASKTIRQDS